MRLQLQQIQYQAAATQMAGLQLAQVSRQPGLVRFAPDPLLGTAQPVDEYNDALTEAISAVASIFSMLQVMTGMDLVRNEGLAALYKGIYPAVARGLFYGGRAPPPTAFHRNRQCLSLCKFSDLKLQAACLSIDHVLCAGVRLDATALPKPYWATPRTTSPCSGTWLQAR